LKSSGKKLLYFVN